MSMNNDAPEWLTMNQYADLTQTSVSSVKRHIYADKLPYTRFGRTVRIPRQALNYEWLTTWRDGNTA